MELQVSGNNSPDMQPGNQSVDLDKHQVLEKTRIKHNKRLGYLNRTRWLALQGSTWKEVGGIYPYLDFPSGICFVCGATLFTIVPALQLANISVQPAVLLWIYMVGVILFVVAKFFVELRVAYAQLFKRTHVGASYQLAILGLLIGGLLFGGALVLALNNGSSLSIAICSLLSAILFLMGSVGFVLNAWPNCKLDKFKEKTSNMCLVGSLSFVLGSVMFIVGSVFKFDQVQVPVQSTYVMSLLGAICFFQGGMCFLILGYWEMYTFKAGPDIELPQVRRRMERLMMLSEP